MDVNFTSRGLSVLLASALSLSIPVAAYSQGGHQTKPSSVKGQQGKVFLRGQVVDNTSVGLPGVSVYTNGKTLLAVTDVNGNFTITKPIKIGSVLSFVSVGLKPQRVTYNGQASAKVVMVDDVNELGDVVVTGVVNKMKNSFTGSAATFSGDQLKNVGTQNAIASLKTLDP